MSERMVVDAFAGPGGWDEGLSMLDVDASVVGLEWDKAACETARAAGHARIRCDVAAYPTEPFAGLWGFIASPPCQAWSMAGKRKGELDRANCHVLADRMAAGDDSIGWTAWEDERSALVCQPVRWVRDLRPEWVALEEVPAVASLWEHFARIFRGWGYSVWTGDLLAADFGVPQTRTRRILMASRTFTVQPPEPTHAEHPLGADLFGGSVEKWVSMAAALGWSDLTFVQRERSGDRATEGFDAAVVPAQALTSKARSWTRLPKFVSAGVTGEGRPKTLAQPADTLTGKGTAYWVHERPATTVVGSFKPEIISAPGYRTQVSRQNAEGGVRVTVAEGGVLQSFPPDYPWRGSRTKQYQQVGNAIPPLLAAHILAALRVGRFDSLAVSA